jgi:hypothetical protein
MSHFTVLVVTDSEPDDSMLTEALQPFHDFECTGTDDKYVQCIDKTDEFRKNWEDHKDDYPEFLTYLKEWEGIKSTSSPDTSGEHKYGYALIDEIGVVTKVIDRTNPNKEWDWWTVGGRWSGKILRTDGHRCDSAMKSSIDFDGIRELKSREAGEENDKITSILAAVGLKNDWHAWEHVREIMFPGDINAARTFYNGQPQITALKSAHIWELDPFLQSREEFVAEAAKNSFSTFAVLKDGKWSEKGDMGWWGCVRDEKDPDAWHQEFEGILSGIRDDQWLTVVDCHI